MRRVVRDLLFAVFAIAAFFGIVLAIPRKPDCTMQLPVPEICKHATSANLVVGLGLLAIAAIALAAAVMLGSRPIRRGDS